MKGKKTFIINFVISVVIVFLLFKFANLNLIELWQQIKTTNIFWFSMCALAFFIQLFTNAYRWNVLTKLLDYPVKYMQALSWYFQGAFSNSFFPTNLGGDALRAYYLGKEKKDWLRAGGTVLVERMLGFLMMIANIPIGIGFLYIYRMDGAVPSILIYAAWALFAGTVIAILTYKLWSKITFKPIEKIRFAVDEYTSCHKSLSKVFLWTFITHVFLIFANISAAKAIGLGFSTVPFWYWFLVIPAAILVSFIVPSMRGVGAKEASYVYLLGFLGVSTEQALALAFVVFVSMLVSSLPGLVGVIARLEKKVRAVSRA